MFVNRMPRFEPLSQEALATIEAGVERLAAEVGVQFDHPHAIEAFAAAGQTVDGDTVRFDPGFLRAQAAKAPESFSLHAREPARDVVVGGKHMVVGPAQGPPFVRADGVRRDGTMADLERLIMLTLLTDALDTPGRNILEPNDVPLGSTRIARANGGRRCWRPTSARRSPRTPRRSSSSSSNGGPASSGIVVSVR